MEDKLNTLYNNLIKEGYDLPEFTMFKADMYNPVNSIKLHDNLVKEGYDLPDYETFIGDMGLKKKVETISEGGGEPSQPSSTEQPQLPSFLEPLEQPTGKIELTDVSDVVSKWTRGNNIMRPLTATEIKEAEIQKEVTKPIGTQLETPSTLLSQTPEYIEKFKDVEKPRNKVSTDLFRTLEVAGLKSAGGILASPQHINTSIGKPLLRPLVRLMGVPDEQVDQTVNAIISQQSLNAPWQNYSEFQEPLNKKAEEIGKTITQLDGDIWSNLLKGKDGERNVAVALEQFGRGVVTSIPMLIQVGLTRNAGAFTTWSTLTATSAAQQYAETEGMTDWKRSINSWSYGGLEAFGELASAYIFGLIGKAFKGGMQGTLNPQNAMSIAKGIGKSIGIEGSSEGITQIGQNITAILTGEDPERSIFAGFFDAITIGGLGFGAFGGVAQLAAAPLGRALASDKEVESVQENFKQQEALIEQLEVTDSDPVKEALKRNIKDLRVEADETMAKNYALAKKLTPEQRDQVANLYSVWNKLQDEIDSGKLPEARVKALTKTIDGLKEQIQTIQEEVIAKLEEEKQAREAKKAKGKEGEKKAEPKEKTTALEDLIKEEMKPEKVEPTKVEPTTEEKAEVEEPVQTPTKKFVPEYLNEEQADRIADKLGLDKNVGLIDAPLSLSDIYNPSFKDFPIIKAIKEEIGVQKAQAVPELQPTEQKQEIVEPKQEIGGKEDAEERTRTSGEVSEEGGTETGVGEIPSIPMGDVIQDREKAEGKTGEIKPIYAIETKPELKFLEQDLPTKKPNKKDRIDLEESYGLLRIKPIQYKVKSKSENEALSNAVAKDELRPVMNGILYDTENQVKVASDAQVLVVIPTKVTGKTRVIDPKTNQEIKEVRYPDYRSVVPDNINIVKIGLQDIADKTNGIKRANDFVTGWGSASFISAEIKYDGRKIWFDPSVLMKGISALMESGTTDVFLELPNDFNRAIILRDAKDSNKYALVMPVQIFEDKGIWTTVLDTKTNVDENIVKKSIERLEKKDSWGQKYHAEQLKIAQEKNDEESIKYHTKQLQKANEERATEIEALKANLPKVEPAPKTKSEQLKVKEEEVKPAKVKPIKEGEIKVTEEGVQFGDKVYTEVEQVQDDYFNKTISFVDQNRVLEEVRKFEDKLRGEAREKSVKIAEKRKLSTAKAEAKLKKNIDDLTKLTVKFFPIDISKANTALWKQLSKVRDIASDWMAGKLQEGMTSQRDGLRWVSKTITNWFGGLGRTEADILSKLKMVGTSREFAPYEAQQLQKQLNAVVNSDAESLRRVRDVLDPEIAQEQLTYDDLTDSEKNLYDALHDLNVWVHETNYANAFIPTSTYQKFQDKYIARMYDEFEIVPKEISEFIKQGSNTINTDIFKARKDIDDWKKEHAIADPVYLTVKRVMQTLQNEAIKEYMDFVKINHPNFVKDVGVDGEVPKGYTKLSDSYRWGALRGMAVANHIVEDFTGYFYANKLANMTYDALKLFDRNKLNQFFKKWHTIYNPFVQAGNFTGNLFFSSIAGINPVVLISEMPSAAKDAKEGTDEYKAVLKSGILGRTGITGDMVPVTSSNLQSVNGTTKAQGFLEDVLSVFGIVDEKLVKLYQGTDNIAKYAAYKVFRKQGLTHEQSIRRVYDSFQNYATVGKTWDVASKLPVIGNKFIKFQADLQRILANGLTNSPLTTIGTFMLIGVLGQLASRLSGEDEEEKEVRETRKGVAKVPIIGTPLSFKVGKKEVNVARYLSPLYLYRYGDSEADISEISKFLPIQLQRYAKPQVGEETAPLPTFADPTLGWIAALVFDKDFRGVSIQNPQASPYFNPNPTKLERIANMMNYAARSQLPFYKSTSDMLDGMTGRLDYYGRKKTWSDAILNNIVKIQEFDDPELKRYVEGNIEYLTNRFAALSERMGNANSSYLKEIARAKEQGMEEKYLERLTKEQDQIRLGRIENSLNKQVPIMQEIERLSGVYKKWYPDDPFVRENFMSIEAGKNRIFDVQSDIDLQKKYKEEYNLLKSNGLLNPYKPEIPQYWDKVKLTEKQKKKYAATYWSEYVRNLDEYIGLTQEEIDEAKADIVSEQETTRQLEPLERTQLQRLASKSASEAKNAAEDQLDWETGK